MTRDARSAHFFTSPSVCCFESVIRFALAAPCDWAPATRWSGRLAAGAFSKGPGTVDILSGPGASSGRRSRDWSRDRYSRRSRAHRGKPRCRAGDRRFPARLQAQGRAISTGCNRAGSLGMMPYGNSGDGIRLGEAVGGQFNGDMKSAIALTPINTSTLGRSPRDHADILQSRRPRRDRRY